MPSGSERPPRSWSRLFQCEGADPELMRLQQASTAPGEANTLAAAPSLAQGGLHGCRRSNPHTARRSLARVPGLAHRRARRDGVVDAAPRHVAGARAPRAGGRALRRLGAAHLAVHVDQHGGRGARRTAGGRAGRPLRPAPRADRRRSRARRALLPRAHARSALRRLPRDPFRRGLRAHLRALTAAGACLGRASREAARAGDGRDRLGAAARRGERRPARRPARCGGPRHAALRRRGRGRRGRRARPVAAARDDGPRARAARPRRDRAPGPRPSHRGDPAAVRLRRSLHGGLLHLDLPALPAQHPRAAAGAHRSADRGLHAAVCRALVSVRHLVAAHIPRGRALRRQPRLRLPGREPRLLADGRAARRHAGHGHRGGRDVRAVAAVHRGRHAGDGAHHLDGGVQRRRQPGLHPRADHGRAGEPGRRRGLGLGGRLRGGLRRGGRLQDPPGARRVRAHPPLRARPARRPGGPVKRSESRILTTHAGSLPRPAALTALLARRSRGEVIDARELAAAIDAARRRAVEGQLGCGIDVGNDGEQPRESFFTHVRERMSGFGGRSQRPVMRDIVHFPSFLAQKLPDFQRESVNLMAAPRAEAEVRYVDAGPLERELADYRRALAGAPGAFVESFWTSPSPGIVACAMENAHYTSLEAYVDALADALREEWQRIVAAGCVLQIDAPDLAMERHTLFADRPLAEFLRFVEHTVAAIDRALALLPREQVRLHVCWGNYEAPHLFDVALEEVLPRVLEARVGALVLAMANPRHAHEHRVLRRIGYPKDRLLVAGVIDTTTNYVEHPELVAERIEQAAEAIGDPRRVLAGTDCGFGTAAGLGEVAEEVVWEKLRALRAGADLATRRLID